MAPLVFGWSVNPISTKGGRLCLPNNTGTPGFSDLPTALQAKSWPENGQCQGNHQMIGDYLLKLKREYDHSLLVNRDSACPTSKVQLTLRRSKYSIFYFYISLRCLELKSYGFKKKLVDSCQASGWSCQHLIFLFSWQNRNFYWLRTKELCWEASAVSFKFFFIFLSSS